MELIERLRDGWSNISFPGLGIDETWINSTAFGNVAWYGVIIALGMLCAIAYAAFRCKQQGIKIDDLIDIAIFTIISGVAGARAYYVIFDDDKSKYETFIDYIAIWRGGLAIYGGIIFGALAIVIVCLVKKISWRKLFDAVGPGVMIAQAIGRWGNFCNGEAYGSIVEEGHPLYFMRMGLISKNTYYEFGTTQTVYVHPCFLYESLWNITGFILINLLFKKKKFDGQIALYYFAWYGFGRMFIEGLRTDALFIGNTGIRVSQLLGFLLFMVATALLVFGFVVTSKNEKKLALATSAALDEEEYEEVEEESDSEEEVEDETENG